MTKKYGTYEVNGGVVNDLLAQTKGTQRQLEESRAESIRLADRLDNVNAELLTKDKQLATKDEGLDAALKYQLALSTTINAQAVHLKIARDALEFQRDQIGSDMEALHKQLIHSIEVNPHGNREYIALQCRLQSVQEALVKLPVDYFVMVE